MESGFEYNHSDLILENLLDAVIILDQKGYIIYVNNAATTLFNKDLNALKGENFGYPVVPYEIQEIQIIKDNKRCTFEMLATTINWKGEKAFLMSLRDVTEKKKMEMELHAVNSQLKQNSDELKELNTSLVSSNEALEQFAHVASHDLKEPLRKIVTFCNLIGSDCEAYLPDPCTNYLQKIEKSAMRMFSMIDGVLTYSSINGAEQSIEEVDLNDIINDIEADLELLITEKNAIIQREELPAIEGAPVLLYQLFYNLINNSLKFSKKEEQPVIQFLSKKMFRNETMYAEIIIKDNGIGFSQQYAEKIFHSFQRLNSKDDYEGTGLGLSLCKKIVLRHHGHIKANGSDGEGAEFIIDLPYKQPKQNI